MKTRRLLLVSIVLASLEVSVRGGELLAKPARVPFTEGEDGEILLHLSSRLLRQCRDPLVHVTDEARLVESRTRLGDTAASHTDRFGLQWAHVSFNLRSLPLGVTRVRITACGASVVTKASV